MLLSKPSLAQNEILTNPWAVFQDQETEKSYLRGTHRMYDPAETYQTISAKFEMMGITRVADVTGLDTIGIPVCIAIRPNAKSLSVSQGKGASLIAAKVSAAMESIEGFHAENIDAELLRSSYAELSREKNALDPVTLNMDINSIYHPYLPITWMAGYDLLNNAEIYVPYDLVRQDFLHEPISPPLFWQGSNGLASGNHILEAISHAICEVVERDANALWELPSSLPEKDNSYLDLATIDSPMIQAMLEKLQHAGVEVSISNQTSSIGIPVFECDIFMGDAVNASTIPIYSGYGCHLSKEIALSRAITEAVQSRLTLISGSRDDIGWRDYQETLNGESRSNWQKYFQKIKPVLDWHSLPSLETDSLTDDVNTQLSMLRKAGFDKVAVVDLTKPEIGIAVARVIIPGAQVSYSITGYFDRKKNNKYILRKLMELLEK